MTRHGNGEAGVEEFLNRRNPERQAGGYSRWDATVHFYQRIDALIAPDMTLLDLGAGRGKYLDDACAYRRRLQSFKGRVARVVGMDPDPVVLSNPGLDEAHVIEPGRLPAADASFDLIVSDWVLEHVAEPGDFAAEVARILKPGGWFCARTPNAWSPVALATRLVPNALHARLLRRVQPDRKARDVFPTAYRLNTPGALKRYFEPARWRHASYRWRTDPAYFFGSPLVWSATSLAAGLSPEGLRHTMLVFLQRRA